MKEAHTANDGSSEEVVEETINAYRVQKMGNGSVRIKSGGRVSQAPTYYEALENYATWQQREVEDSPDHLRERYESSIYDGVILLLGGNSDGFAPEEILDEVTGQPLESVLDDLAQNMGHDDLCWCYVCEGRGELSEEYR